ncbi:uncharacterized protein AKAME5_002992100 [Lates japonicus]|uniref:Ig-like domain-containing protein n=1 Tax=Lates japonicus TaxID=270547 RepID=A0AAD3R8R5_LATJO|nr:uncharacterized protein AKAME5_002992100 [Lates japonicus]
MILLWVTLVVLHQVYSLVPVVTVQLGEPVTLTCPLPNVEISGRQIHWNSEIKPYCRSESTFGSSSSRRPADSTVFVLSESENKIAVQEITEQTGSSGLTAPRIAIVCLAISVIGNIVFICCRIQRAVCVKAAVSLHKNSGSLKSQQRHEDMLVYSAVIFTMMKAGGGAIKDGKAAERERIYAAVKSFGLD